MAILFSRISLRIGVGRRLESKHHNQMLTPTVLRGPTVSRKNGHFTSPDAANRVGFGGAFMLSSIV